jgi:hypothetical protein
VTTTLTDLQSQKVMGAQTFTGASASLADSPEKHAFKAQTDYFYNDPLRQDFSDWLTKIMNKLGYK